MPGDQVVGSNAPLPPFGGGHASDEEVLAHYRQKLEAVGGTSPGSWHIAVAFISPPGQLSVACCRLEARLTSQASPVRVPGAPLSSLMLDPISGRYYAEMSSRERPDSTLIADILHPHIERLGRESREG